MKKDSVAQSSTSVLTLKYAAAAVSVLAAVYMAIETLLRLFGLWTNSTAYLVAGGYGYVNIVTYAVSTALFAVLAFLLYRRVTKDVAVQPEYVDTPVYHVITNGLVGALAFVLVLLVADIISTLISSLLLIGSNADIGGLYLNKFLPNLVAAGIVGVAGFSAFKIMKGQNKSFLMTIVLMSVAGALLLAMLITVPIKAHSSDTTNNRSSEYDSRYFDMFSN